MDSKNIEEIEFSQWLFEGRLRQGENVLPDGLNWLCYFAGSSKSHCENSISFIFLESPHQVDVKKGVKSSKHFFGYFDALETHNDMHSTLDYCTRTDGKETDAPLNKLNEELSVLILIHTVL